MLQHRGRRGRRRRRRRRRKGRWGKTTVGGNQIFFLQPSISSTPCSSLKVH